MRVFDRYLRFWASHLCWSSAGLSYFVLLCVLLFSTTPAQGQRQIVSPARGVGGVYLPSARRDARGIEQARNLIAGGEFSQAIRFLDEILAREEDSFLAVSGSELSGLKEAAHQILRNLPSDGQQIYETTYGPVARRLLKQSVESGDLGQLRQIARRYFHTPAGYEAALLFAQYESDQGRHLTAALTYQQLLQTPAAAERFQPQLGLLCAISWLAAENEARASQVLEDLEGNAYSDIQVSGKGFSLQALQETSLEWLTQTVGTPVTKESVPERQWLTTRGNPARNGQTEGSLPHLRPRWQVRLLQHKALETIHDGLAGVRARQKKSRLPAAVPIAAGDYIITRSAHGLVAINFKTGKRIWQAEPQQETLLKNVRDASQQLGQNQNRNGVNVTQDFSRLIWQDYLYNTTSSDGRRVYAIRDLTMPRWSTAQAAQFGRLSTIKLDDETKSNRLCAYDLPTEGKLVWEIDGKVRSDELKGVFFLGAPVAVGQSLYCLVEMSSETAIYLVALDRETGALQWRQQLADLELGIAFDSHRRLQSLMPSYDSGILVCPTGAGVVVGVDLAKQALAWAFRYETNNRLSPQQQLQQLRRTRRGIQPSIKTEWVHSTPVIVDGRILLTPPESDKIHCIDLVTGKLIWEQSRSDALFLAGVEDETLLLVGNSRVKALRLENGKSAWAKVSMELEAGGVPVGSGFFSQGKYFLPLSNSQVVAIDLNSGKIVSRTTSREGRNLGNLICYRGAVISQSGRFLDCFEQIEVLRAKSEQQRAVDPNDFEALRTLGEIAYNEGSLKESVELLKQAYENQPTDFRTKAVLSDALIAALSEDFGGYQDQIPFLAGIQQGTAGSQLTMLRLQAEGLLQLGRAAKSFKVCIDVYEQLPAVSDVRLKVQHKYQADAYRWLAMQATVIWEAASIEERQEIAEQLTKLVAGVKQTDDLEAWHRFYDCFGVLGPVESIGLELAQKFIDNGNLLAGQQVLLRLVHSENDMIRFAAVANSSRLLHEANMPHLALPFDAKLRGTLADVECLPGLSGSQCLEEWADYGEHDTASWPLGKVEWKQRKPTDLPVAQARRNPRNRIPLERADGILGNCSIVHVNSISRRNQEVVVRDSLGHILYQGQLGQSGRNFVNPSNSTYGVSLGNLLVLSLGHEIVAFNTLSDSDKPIWQINTNLQTYQGRLQLHVSRDKKKASRSLSSDGKWVGIIGPVTADSCVFQIEDRLVCVDSLTGETLWSRGGVPLGCDLYGDERHVFALPRGERKAMIYSTIDGRSLGETDANIPLWKERWATIGGKTIRWRRRPDRRWELSCRDSLSGEIFWKHAFEKSARLSVIQNRFAAVVEPKGHCVITDLRSGELVVDQPIQANSNIRQLHFMVGSKHFLLAVQQLPHVAGTKRVTPLVGYRGNFASQPFAGQVYLFDRDTGRSVWGRGADIQSLPFLLDQPMDLPVVVFAGNVRRQNAKSSKQSLGVMLLEKSSGRQLYHNEDFKQSYLFQVRVSKNEPNAMSIQMLEEQVDFKFTDRPRPPEPPALYKTERKVGDSSQGLQKLGNKLLQGGRAQGN